MSNDALTWAWSQKVGCAAAKTVLVAMADRASEDHTCWPSIRRLVQDTELSARTIYRHINDLVAKGFLERTPVLGKGVIYRLVGVKGREDSKPRPDPCHNDTPVTVSPLSPCHPCQDDTPVTVSPDPCHCVSATRASSYEPKEEPKDKNIYTASATPDAAHADEPSYLTKRKKRLTGKRLETFKRFWEAFAYRRGKAEAADAWLDIPKLTNSLVDKIVAAAEREAAARPDIVASGRTPKMAQGWLSGRRWEDEPEHGFMHEKTLDDLLLERGIPQ